MPPANLCPLFCDFCEDLVFEWEVVGDSRIFGVF
jgi:hypothetical protein